MNEKNNLSKYVADILVDTINIFTNIIDILKILSTAR